VGCRSPAGSSRTTPPAGQCSCASGASW
jgi:hypothetical protein